MPVLKNSRHEKYAFALFQGMSQQEAAIKAGYTSKYNECIASRLVKNSQVMKRVEELHIQSETPGCMTVERRKVRLTEIAEEDNDSKYGYQRMPNISAIAELNKMTPGVYEPIKVDLSEGLAKLLNELHGNRLPQLEEGDQDKEGICQE